MKIKQIFCKHEWKAYKVNEEGPFLNISGEKRVLACPKCQKIKKNSEHIAKYEGMGLSE